MPIDLSALQKVNTNSLRKVVPATIGASKQTPLQKLTSKLPEPIRRIGGYLKEGLFGSQGVDITGETRFSGGLLQRGDSRQQNERALESIVPFALLRPKKPEQRVFERAERLRPLVDRGEITEQRADEIAKDVLQSKGPKATIQGKPIRTNLKLTDAEKKALRPLVIEETLDKVFAGLDVVSVGSIKPLTKKAVERIALSVNPDEIFKILKKEIPDLADDAATVFSRALTQIDNADDVQKVFNRTNLALQNANKTSQQGRQPLKEIFGSKQTPDPLLSEARKYKSAEEFVRAQEPLYHGTKKTFDTPIATEERIGTQGRKQAGAYLSADREYAASYGQNVKEVYVNLKNPLVISDTDGTAYSKVVSFTKKDIENLKRQGYDGVIYNTEYNGKKLPKNEVIVFDQENIKTKSQLTDIWNKAQGDDKSLLVAHNLTEQKLLFANRIGGLANPSLAVIDPKLTGFDSYGDITLIAPKDLIRGQKTKLSDAYSPRFPSVHTTIGYDDYQKLQRELEPFYKEIGEDARKVEFDDTDIIRYIENNPAVALKFLKEKGITPSSKGQHYFHPQIREAGLESEYLDFLDDIYKKFGVKEKMFAGYTNSGQRRYKAVTAEEASKVMSKQKDEGFSYGLGSYRSKISPTKTTPEAIKKEKGRLVTKEQFEAIQESYDNELFALRDKLTPYAKNIDSNSFIEFDRQLDTIGGLLSGERDALQYFKAKFPDAPKELLQEVYDFRDKLKNMPTEYFESKFNRPVKIDEFTIAVVPEATSKKTVQLLKDKGLEVITYEEGKKQEVLKQLTSRPEAFGAVGGIEVDDEGNVTFDPMKAALGVGVARIAKKGTKTTQGVPGTKSPVQAKAQQKIERLSEVVPTSPRKSSLGETISDNGKKVNVNVGTPEERLKATGEETDSIKDVLNRSEMRIRDTSAKGTEPTARNLAQEITDNIKKQNETLKDTEIASLREKNLLGAETIDEIILRKRGVITDKEAIKRAKNIRGTIDDVLNIPKGSVPTKEQLTAVSQIVQTEREINQKIIQLIDGSGVAQSADERALIKKLGESFQGLEQHELLNRALAESTLKLKKAEIVLLGMRAEAGRTLQATKIVAEAVESRMRIVFGKIQKLNPTEQQAFLERLAKEDVRDDKKFIKFLEELNTADFFDKVAEYSTAAKLWNPTTHVVNFGGNTLRMLTDIAITAGANPRGVRADIMGAKVGLSRGLKNALRAMTDEGYASQLSKYIEEGGTAPAIGGKLGQWVRTPFRMLGAGDEVFRAIGFQRSIYRQADAIARSEGLKGAQHAKRMEELLNTPTHKMLEDATEQSKRLTFQEDMGELTKKINEYRTPASFKTKTGKTMAAVLRFFLPFLKTPTNLIKQAVDFSPFGGVKNFKKLKQAAKNGDTETVGRIIGESVVGTALMAYIIMETLDGNITGGAPRNKSERDRFYRENKIPYAIKIGGKWYQYKRVDPFATMMSLTSDATTLSNEEDLSVSAMINTFANQMADKTYLQGIGDFMNLMTGEEWEREYALKSMVLGATLPSFFGHVARSMDSTVRNADTIVDRIKSQIPFVSESLPVQVNVLGGDIQRANKGLNYFFNPIQSEVAEIDPITKHLMDIDKTLSIPQDFFSRDGVKYELDAETYSRYTKEVGTELKNEIEQEMRKSSYQAKSDEEKGDRIDEIRKKILDEWKDGYVKGKSRSSLNDIFRSTDTRAPLADIFK